MLLKNIEKEFKNSPKLRNFENCSLHYIVFKGIKYYFLKNYHPFLTLLLFYPLKAANEK